MSHHVARYSWDLNILISTQSSPDQIQGSPKNHSKPNDTEILFIKSLHEMKSKTRHKSNEESIMPSDLNHISLSRQVTGAISVSEQ